MVEERKPTWGTAPPRFIGLSVFGSRNQAKDLAVLIKKNSKTPMRIQRSGALPLTLWTAPHMGHCTTLRTCAADLLPATIRDVGELLFTPNDPTALPAARFPPRVQPPWIRITNRYLARSCSGADLRQPGSHNGLGGRSQIVTLNRPF